MKPTPPTAATPASSGQRTPAGRRPRPLRTVSHVAATMPSGLPRTRPSHDAQGDRVADRRPSRPYRAATRPALASANSGRTTNAVHGCRRDTRRSSGDTASWASAGDVHERDLLPLVGAAVRRARPSSVRSSAPITAVTASGGWNGQAGVSEPQHDPGDRRVHARQRHERPQQAAQHEVGRQRPHLHALQADHGQHHEHAREDPQRPDAAAARVEDRDHEDRARRRRPRPGSAGRS